MQLQINLLLKKLIGNGFFSLANLNSQIVFFCYSPIDAVNKQTPYSKSLTTPDTLLKNQMQMHTHFDCSVSSISTQLFTITATQTWCLA